LPALRGKKRAKLSRTIHHQVRRRGGEKVWGVEEGREPPRSKGENKVLWKSYLGGKEVQEKTKKSTSTTLYATGSTLNVGVGDPFRGRRVSTKGGGRIGKKTSCRRLS